MKKFKKTLNRRGYCLFDSADFRPYVNDTIGSNCSCSWVKEVTSAIYYQVGLNKGTRLIRARRDESEISGGSDLEFLVTAFALTLTFVNGKS